LFFGGVIDKREKVQKELMRIHCELYFI